MDWDLLRIGWNVVRVAMLVAFIAAVMLGITMAMRSIAGAEEIGQPRYSQYSESTEWYDSYGRLRYGPQGNFTSRDDRSASCDISCDRPAPVASSYPAPRFVGNPPGTWDASGRWIDYSSPRQMGPWESPAVRAYHWERVPIPMGIPPKDAWRGLLDWHF